MLEPKSLTTLKYITTGCADIPLWGTRAHSLLKQIFTLNWQLYCKPIPDHLSRLNRPGESILYVSKEIINAIYETKCEKNDNFFLLVYENKGIMRISQIHNIPYMEVLTEEENAKMIICIIFFCLNLQSLFRMEWNIYIKAPC